MNRLRKISIRPREASYRSHNFQESFLVRDQKIMFFKAFSSLAEISNVCSRANVDVDAARDELGVRCFLH